MYTYNDCLKKYGNEYQVNKALNEGRLYRIEKGVYSERKFEWEEAVIRFKYPKAVYTLNSAFYYHNLTDVIPEKHYLATARGTRAISDNRVKQIFENANVELGVTEMLRNNVSIRVYNRERMLIELFRNKNKLSFDYYKEIIENYRRIIDELDMQKIQDYMEELPKSGMVMETLQREVL